MAAFAELGVMGEIIRALEGIGWMLPTPIQQEAIPLILGGGDVMVVRRCEMQLCVGSGHACDVLLCAGRRDWVWENWRTWTVRSARHAHMLTSLLRRCVVRHHRRLRSPSFKPFTRFAEGSWNTALEPAQAPAPGQAQGLVVVPHCLKPLY